MSIEELLKSMSDIVDNKLEPIGTRLGRMENRINNLDNRMKSLESQLEKLDKNLNSIELTLENETNRNMQLIAEGQTLINRRLEEALRFESEKEMMLLKVNHLENEIRKIKGRLETE